MKNATEYYKTSDKILKAPGQWVALSETKKMLKTNEANMFFNKKGGEYFFSPELFNQYINAVDTSKKKIQTKRSETQSKPQEQKWFDAVYKNYTKVMKEKDVKLINDRVYQRITGLSPSAIYRKFGVRNLWEESSDEIKEVVAAFVAPIAIEVTSQKGAGSHYINSMMVRYDDLLNRNVVFSKSRIVFNNENFRVVMNKHNVLAKEEL